MEKTIKLSCTGRNVEVISMKSNHIVIQDSFNEILRLDKYEAQFIANSLIAEIVKQE